MTLHSPVEKLSPHFTWREFFMHDGSPAPDELFLPAKRLCVMYLEPVRRAYGVCTVVSGWRSAAHNRSVGGAPASTHLGLRRPPAIAADVVFRSGTPREWHEAFDQLGVPGLGLYDTHVHVDNRPGRARW